MFYADQPTSEDYLWKNNREVTRFRERVVRMIIEGSPRSQTIAIHGRWGRGKTTLWKQIRKELEEASRQGHIPTKLFIAEVSVDRTNQRASIAPVQVQGGESGSDSFFAHLIREIVLSMDHDFKMGLFEKIGILSEWSNYVPKGNSQDNRPATLREDLPHLERFLADQKFEDLVGRVFASLPRFTRWLEAELQGKGTQSSAARLVICVDDLDRCEALYVGEVVRTIRCFHEIDGVYVFLLVDKQMLREAFGLLLDDYRGVRTVDEALERYINVAFHLPVLTPDLATKFAVQLNSGRASHDLSALNDVQSIIPFDFVIKLIPPQRLTPRAVKNTLSQLVLSLPDLDPLDQSSQDSDLIKRRVKEVMLEMYYEDVAYIYRENYEAFREIETAFATAQLKQPSGLEILNKLVQSICERHRISYQLFEDAHLQTVLREPPYLYYLPENSFEHPVDLTAQNLSPHIEHQQDVKNQLSTLHSAVLRGNENLARAILRQVLTAPLTSADAPTLASAAQTARQTNLTEMAVELFEKALELDPNHEDILQAYVALIIDEEVIDRYEQAEECLSRLLKDPRVPKDDYAFTLALAVRWAILKGEDYTEYLNQLLGEWRHSQEIGIFRRIAVALNKVKALDERLAVEEFCRIYRDAEGVFTARADYQSLYHAHRSAADFLASMSNPEYEHQAMDLYRAMYRGEIPIEEGDRADILHNYATLLYKHDYDAEAGRVWCEAYKLNPNDANIRRGFASYLLRYGSPGLAQLVFEGGIFPQERLPKIPERQLPERFARRKPCETQTDQRNETGETPPEQGTAEQNDTDAE